MTCYEILTQLAQDGKIKIYINLCNKTLKVGRTTIIKDGQVIKNKIFNEEFSDLLANQLDIDKLYQQYKYSMPSARDNGQHYFKALSVNELSDADLVTGIPRYLARVQLEAYILLASMTGHFKWQNPNHWFWLGKDKDFVILKKYI